ncbi:MAG: response regulator transcription factor, partial [Candidatus Eremiobacteraeota bacterium]|nr:response regulator transcription factor [Candidatus Eremiobacteraeota bacterium]
MSQARILLVEDDPDIAKLERTFLERSGYEVRHISSGAEALELAATYRPDVVILDVGLPDISGLDVCTSLATSNDAFILMVSGHSREQDVLLGLGLGADDYITKPFSGNELVARVASFLRRREKYLEKKEDAGVL